MSQVEFPRILAIDYGAKRVGLAITDPFCKMSFPLTTLQNNDFLIRELGKIIKEKDVTKIVMGVPYGEGERNQALIKKIETISNLLVTKYNVEIINWDENFTSAHAKEKILTSVSKKNKRRDKGLVDQVAAAIILEEYLEANPR